MRRGCGRKYRVAHTDQRRASVIASQLLLQLQCAPSRLLDDLSTVAVTIQESVLFNRFGQHIYTELSGAQVGYAWPPRRLGHPRDRGWRASGERKKWVPCGLAGRIGRAVADLLALIRGLPQKRSVVSRAGVGARAGRCR